MSIRILTVLTASIAIASLALFVQPAGARQQCPPGTRATTMTDGTVQCISASGERGVINTSKSNTFRSGQPGGSGGPAGLAVQDEGAGGKKGTKSSK
jgi:hypothetical protein